MAVAAIGQRVVRNPNWTSGDQDEKEGTLGTVIQLSDGARERSDTGGDSGAGSDTPTSTACSLTVFWDSGHKARYSCGADGKYCLRLVDSSVTGAHKDSTCSECPARDFTSILWLCQQCADDGVQLCNICYHNLKHDTDHQFWAVPYPGCDRIDVPVRDGAVQLTARGVFPGAKVCRGPHWDYGEQDGGKGSVGVVTDLAGSKGTSMQGILVTVSWPSGTRCKYRLGIGGKVDVKCVEVVLGSFYFPEHLPVLVTSKRTVTLPTADASPATDHHGTDVESPVTRSDFTWAPNIPLLRKPPVPATATPSTASQVDETSVSVSTTAPSEVLHAVQASSSTSTPSSAAGSAAVGSTSASSPPSYTTGGDGANSSSVSALGDSVGPLDEDPGETMLKLIRAGDMELLRLLLENYPGTVTRRTSGRHQTAAHIAAMHGRVAELALIREFGGRLDAMDVDGNTPIHFAANGDNSHTIQCLCGYGVSANPVNHEGRTPLHVACQEGNKAAVAKLCSLKADVKIQDQSGNTPLHVAVVHDRDECVEVLLDAGADIGAMNYRDENVLQLAACRGCEKPLRRMAEKSPEFVRIANSEGKTPLHMAVNNNHVLAAEAILQQPGCQMDRYDGSIVTALMLACVMGFKSSTELLVAYGADFHREDAVGNTALHVLFLGYLSRTGPDARPNIDGDILCEHCPEIDKIQDEMEFDTYEERMKAAIACFLAREGCSLQQKNSDGLTPVELCKSEKIRDLLFRYYKPPGTSPFHGHKQREATGDSSRTITSGPLDRTSEGAQSSSGTSASRETSLGTSASAVAAASAGEEDPNTNTPSGKSGGKDIIAAAVSLSGLDSSNADCPQPKLGREHDSVATASTSSSSIAAETATAVKKQGKSKARLGCKFSRPFRENGGPGTDASQVVSAVDCTQQSTVAPSSKSGTTMPSPPQPTPQQCAAARQRDFQGIEKASGSKSSLGASLLQANKNIQTDKTGTPSQKQPLRITSQQPHTAKLPGSRDQGYVSGAVQTTAGLATTEAAVPVNISRVSSSGGGAGAGVSDAAVGGGGGGGRSDGAGDAGVAAGDCAAGVAGPSPMSPNSSHSSPGLTCTMKGANAIAMTNIAGSPSGNRTKDAQSEIRSSDLFKDSPNSMLPTISDAGEHLDQQMREAIRDGNVTLARQCLSQDPTLVHRSVVYQLNKTKFMHAAAIFGRPGIIELLHEFGGDVNLQLDNGETALIFAAEQGHLSSVETLIRLGANIDVRTFLGHSVLHCAAGRGHEQMVTFLLDQEMDPNCVDTTGNTPLHHAVGRDQVCVVEPLLDHGADMTQANFSSFNAALHAAYSGSCLSLSVLAARQPDVIKSVTEDGLTCLHIAAAFNYYEMVKLLLDVDVLDIDVVDYKLKTPLTTAAFRGKKASVELLVSRGADLTKTDIQGDMAVQNAVLSCYVRAMGVGRDEPETVGSDDHGLSPIIDELQRNMQTGDDGEDKAAAISCFLVQRGSDVYQRNDSGRNAIDLAQHPLTRERLKQHYRKRVPESECQLAQERHCSEGHFTASYRQARAAAGDAPRRPPAPHVARQIFSECVTCGYASDVLFQPCGHTACTACSNLLTECGECGMKVEEKISRQRTTKT